MNLVTLARRRRSTSLAVESIEERLAPSPTLPLPPPHIDPSMVASLTPPEPCVQTVREAATKLAPTFAPPEPCAKLASTFVPPEPCAKLAPSFEPPEPC